jgi:hypothetical protein
MTIDGRSMTTTTMTRRIVPVEEGEIVDQKAYSTSRLTSHASPLV